MKVDKGELVSLKVHDHVPTGGAAHMSCGLAAMKSLLNFNLCYIGTTNATKPSATGAVKCQRWQVAEVETSSVLYLKLFHDQEQTIGELETRQPHDQIEVQEQYWARET